MSAFVFVVAILVPFAWAFWEYFSFKNALRRALVAARGASIVLAHAAQDSESHALDATHPYRDPDPNSLPSFSDGVFDTSLPQESRDDRRAKKVQSLCALEPEWFALSDEFDSVLDTELAPFLQIDPNAKRRMLERRSETFSVLFREHSLMTTSSPERFITELRAAYEAILDVGRVAYRDLRVIAASKRAPVSRLRPRAVRPIRNRSIP